MVDSGPNSPELVQVRAATLDDVKRMAECHTRSIRTAYGRFFAPEDVEMFTVEGTAARIAEQIQNQEHVLVAVVNREVIGHARWGRVESESWPYPVLVHALFIDPEHQRHRAGSALLAACVLGAQADGHSGMMIGAFVENHEALAWYKRLGGRLIETVPLEVGKNSYDSAFLAFDDLAVLCASLAGR